MAHRVTRRGTDQIRKRPLGSSLIAVVAGVSLVFLLGACSSAAPTPTPTSDATPTPLAPTPTSAEPTPTPEPTWEDLWNDLVVKAKEEGEIVIVGGSSLRRNIPMYQAFEREFGIKVNVSAGGSSRAADRILAERAAGRYTIDHFLSGPGTMARVLIPNNFFREILPELFVPEILDKANYYQGRYWWSNGDAPQKYALAFLGEVEQFDLNARWNTELVTQEEFESINSLWDFLDPRWAGRILSNGGDRGGYSRALVHPDLGEDWLRAWFNPDSGITFMTDERLMADMVAQGGFAICVQCPGTRTQLDEIRSLGGPIDDFSQKAWQDVDVFSVRSGEGTFNIVDRPAHLNAARLLANWTFLKTTQEFYLRDIGEYPSLRVDLDESAWTDSKLDPARRPDPNKGFPLILEDLPDWDPEAASVRVREIKDSFLRQ